MLDHLENDKTTDREENPIGLDFFEQDRILTISECLERISLQVYLGHCAVCLREFNHATKSAPIKFT